MSGLTAILLRWELNLLMPFVAKASLLGSSFPAFSIWMGRVYEGVPNGYDQYPFLAYGTDWLAFGHVAIALAFLGPLRDPVRNTWVIDFGILTCILVIPWILILGPICQIPIFWQFIDMCFAIFGMMPLLIVRHDVGKLASEL